MLQITPQPIPSYHRGMQSMQAPATPSVQLPRKLDRPPHVEIDPRAIAAVAPELANVPLEYIQRHLASQAPQMIAAVTLLSIPSSLPRSRLPPTVDAPLRPTASVPPSASFPTHVLAVSSSRSSPSSPSTPTAASFAAQAQQGSSTIVPLYPTHSLVLAAHCTLLPRLPASRAASNKSTAISLPVVPLTVPDAATFPHLHAYLHTKRADTLLATLLPALQSVLPPAAGASSTSGAVRSYATQFTADSLLRYAHALASYAYTQSGPQGAVQTLMAHAKVVNGLWKNTCALGIFDTELWAMMDLAWEIILTALNRIIEMSRR
ncbi:hypothetical protein EIP86_009345 [Pleurotus ostreatoroseus]|nr:hypothetical protein EIP86_009345 [Pleurotus ostreatoroseus]